MGSFRPRNLTDILDILRRRAALIAFVTVIVLIAAFVVVINVPHLYESRTRIVVSGQIYDRQANSAQIAAVTEQLTSRAVLEGMINRYQLVAPETNMDRATTDLANAIKLETKYRSDSNFPESFALAFRHTDPKTAQQVVSDLLGLFSQANATLEHQATEEARQIRSEIAEIESQLSQNHRSRAASAASASAASRAAGYADRARSERNALAASLEQLRDRQYALQQQVANQKRAITQQQEIVRNAVPSDAGNSSMGALLRRKAELEGQIKHYLEQYTDKYPKLLVAREQLAEVEQRINEARASGEGTRSSQATPEAQQLRQMQNELSRMETELEIVEREMARKQQAAQSVGGASAVAAAPVYSPAYSSAPVADSAAPDYTTEGLKERYTQLLKRQEALSVFQPSPAGPATPFFQIVDEPNLPQAPAAPMRSKLMLFALAMALGAALVAAVIAELPRFTRIHDERDIKHFLGVPVIALLPENLTVAERSAQSRQLFARRLRVLLIGAAAIPALAFVLNSTHIFHILGSK
ncbi:MAG: Wzz/FepE/Etk N-terminal domain-containing protein [Blastocatellia bacterium]